MSDDAPTLSDYAEIAGETFDLSEEEKQAISEEIEEIYNA